MQERDEIQAQFAQLHTLRMTEPERILAEWKETAEQQSRAAEEYIATLKEEVETLQKKKSQGMEKDVRHADSDELRELRHSLNESRRREASLHGEVKRLLREVERKGDKEEGQPTSRLATKGGVGSGALGASDERAIRRLYEDLTGLVVNNVERVDGSNSKDSFRRFHAIFACAGYHGAYVRGQTTMSGHSHAPP